MGYQEVMVDLDNGISFKATVLNCEILVVPEEIDIKEIKKINYIY
jgi:hypothetical protein